MGYGVIWRDNNDEDMRIELPEDIDRLVYALAEVGKAVEDAENAKAGRKWAV